MVKKFIDIYTPLGIVGFSCADKEIFADIECPLNSDMVQILYVDKDDQGCAFVEEMRIKENGKFEKEWPTGFFDQGYSLAKQLMRVSSQRGKK